MTIWGAFVIAEMAVHAADGGYNTERVTLLETALDRSRHTRPVTRSYLQLHLAAALAKQREHRKAATALHRSEALWDRVGDERPDWLGWLSASQINSTRGKVTLWAGQASKASDFLAASVGASAPRDRAVRAGRLAEARLAGKDLDGALAAANEGVELMEKKVISARAMGRLKEFSGRLSGYRHVPAVREFTDRLQALPPVEAT